MFRRPLPALLCALGVLAAVPAAHAATAGDLDPSFGTGGRAYWTGLSSVSGGFVAPDGRITVAGGALGWGRLSAAGAAEAGPFQREVGTGTTTAGIDYSSYLVFAAGTTTQSGAARTSFVLNRYNDDGTPAAEPKYADFLTGDATATATASTFPGPVVAGYLANKLALARFRGDTGNLDTGFGADANGMVTQVVNDADGNPAGSIVPHAVLPMPSDGFAVAGHLVRQSGLIDTFVARFNQDGTPFASFGVGGVKALRVNEQESHAVGLALAGGRLLVGIKVRYNSSSALGALGLDPATGAVDTTYGSGGIALGPIAVGNVEATAATADSAGRMLVAGQLIGSHTWAVARFSAAGAPDPGFGSSGQATFTMGDADESAPSAIDVTSGDLPVVAGDALVGGTRQAAVARLLAAGDAPPAATGSGSSGSSGSPSPGSSNPGSTGGGLPPATTVRVGSVDVTLVADLTRRVKMPDVRALPIGPASSAVNKGVPFVDVTWDYSAETCRKGTADGTVMQQSIAPDTALAVSPDAPAKVKLAVCLNARKYAATCSAAKMNKVLKGVKDQFAIVEAFFKEIERCKVDYDVTFVKKGDDAQLGTVSNAPAKAKRKPIEAAIECPADPAQQYLRATWDEGASRPTTYGFHASDREKGWTLPAGEQSFFRVTVTDLAVRFVRAKVYIDTDDVGSPQIPPAQLDDKGQKIFTIWPAKPGLIRTCVVYETADGDALYQTTAIQVIAHPKLGEVWTTQSGRQIKTTKDGPVPVAPASGRAHAAGLIDDAINAFWSLFGNKSKTVAQAYGSSAPAGVKAQKVRQAGYAIGQMSTGGVLGRVPGNATVVQGDLVYLQGGKVGTAKGGVLKGSPSGTLMGVGAGTIAPRADQIRTASIASTYGGGVVSPGGANIASTYGGGVVSPGGANIASTFGGGLIGQATGNLLGAATSNLIGQATGNLIGAAGSNVVSAGGLN